MKVVIDTNVFISGIFWSGPPYEILKAWRDGILEPVVSIDILEEYSLVASELSRKFPQIDIGFWIELVSIKAIVIENPEQYEPICRDPDDDKFILCAEEVDARTIISGDKHLLDMNGYHGIEVLKPKEFVVKYLTT